MLGQVSSLVESFFTDDRIRSTEIQKLMHLTSVRSDHRVELR